MKKDLEVRNLSGLHRFSIFSILQKACVLNIQTYYWVFKFRQGMYILHRPACRGCTLLIWPRVQGVLVNLLPPPPPSFSLWTHDHTLCIQNIKPQCVFISIYQTNPGNKRVFLKMNSLLNTGRLATPSWKILPLVETPYRKTFIR